MSKKPKGFLTCYICQRDFGSQSIQFHEPQCRQKWINENNKLPAHQRSPFPTKPHSSITPLSSRPRTATLEHPKILDINSIHLVDMTIISQKNDRPKTYSLDRPTPNILAPHIQVIHPISTHHEESSAAKPQTKNQRHNEYQTRHSKNNVYKSNNTRKSSTGQQNNNSQSKYPTKANDATSFVILEPHSLPEPCHTCKNSTHPERLHTHPKTKSNSTPGSSISDNVHRISYANQTNDKQKHEEQTSKYKPNISESNDEATDDMHHSHEDKKAAKTSFLKICPVCGRQFGSKSLPIHEPKCREQWQRENCKLTKTQDQRLNSKLRRPASSSNEVGTHVPNCQKSLQPFIDCGQMLPPDAIQGQGRCCQDTTYDKRLDNHINERNMSTDEENIALISPTSIICQLTPRFLNCYICGRDYGSKSIQIHEPQCLKKWRIENAKLPKHIRRPEPQKPQPIFDENGMVDLNTLADASWKSHLSQLIPCSTCKRTFNPDRLQIHERVCQSASKRSFILA